MSVAIITDSNSGITINEAQKLGIYLIQMNVNIDGKDYKDEADLEREYFFEKQKNGADIHTSQPAMGEVAEVFREALRHYDEVIDIPMSSSLSGECLSSMIIAREEEFDGKVYVVDSQRISITQKMDVLNAYKMAQMGKSAKEIYDILMRTKLDASIYVTLDNIEHLKKGGRLTPAAALLGNLLKIKPILQIQGQKLDSYKKARTMSKAKQIMIEGIKKDKEERFVSCDTEIMIAYTTSLSEALDFKRQVQESIPEAKITMCDPLSLCIASHTGPNALGVCIAKKI